MVIAIMWRKLEAALPSTPILLQKEEWCWPPCLAADIIMAILKSVRRKHWDLTTISGVLGPSDLPVEVLLITIPSCELRLLMSMPIFFLQPLAFMALMM